ncbi:hypothetical protein PgNI_10312 [Pyricularia grisea]|uniref:Nephrocystin 3-like N-terminal domain-containing protein n=1 Tax=Pyricularia grisea TaxID=148305 RepID=A0A6P8AZQ2_PYRGI|nr:hypothetical protein PgNI_10312 [Pyricularia grisea]TLD07789.1 hypothetical protein PgNI_10312 [Pyricularia grisea]
MKPVDDVKRRREELENKPELDLRQLWDQAQADFKARTNIDLKAGSLSDRFAERIEEVLAIPPPPHSEADDAEKAGLFSKAFFTDAFHRAKDLFAKVFRVIWKFHEFFLSPVAEGIPLFGSGVTLLTRAIEVLIQATKDYRDIFVKAAELFEQIGFFGMRFEMLMVAESAGVKVPTKFVHFLNKIMAHTVGGVALYIEITNKSANKSAMRRAGHITKQFFKTLALEDDKGVGAHMEELQRLIDEEGRLSTALILSTVLRIQKDVQAVQGSVTTVSDKLSVVHDMITENSPSRVDQLKKLFGIGSEPWNDTFHACAEQSVSGTGGWLLRREDFSAWTTAASEAQQILAIEADSNFGKTFIATQVISHLYRSVKETNGSSAVAFYYFDNSSKDVTASAVIRAIAFQLCMQSPSLLDLVLPVVKAILEPENSSLSSLSSNELWTRLVVNTSSKLPDCTIYIILDGLDHMAEEHLHVLSKVFGSSEASTKHLRILLTGTASTLSAISNNFAMPIPKIALDHTYPNQSDVALITESALLRCDFFCCLVSSSDSTSAASLREYMVATRDALVSRVHGDFYLLRSQLRALQHLLSTSEIERVLGRADQSRTGTIQHHLSDLAVRLSGNELLRLKDTLHLLAILEILGAPPASADVLGQYLGRGQFLTVSRRSSSQAAYAGLISVDPHGMLSLATGEIAGYLLPAAPLPTSPMGSALEQLQGGSPGGATAPQDRQLAAIRSFLKDTFSEKALKTHGIDEEFFGERLRLCSLSDFVLERNAAMAVVAVNLVDCLAVMAVLRAREGDGGRGDKEEEAGVFALARAVLPKILTSIDVSRLHEKTRTDLGTEVARLFLSSAVFDIFWPVEALNEARVVWGGNDQAFESALSLAKQPGVAQRLGSLENSKPWANELEKMTQASDLRMAVSKMLATRWLLSKAFWDYDDIHVFLPWFATVPALGLIEEDVEDDRYDLTRTRDWFTPPNFEKIEAWVTATIPASKNSADFDIQKAAVLLALGDSSDAPTALLSPHCDNDWRALVWLAEAKSMLEDYDGAFDTVEQCLSMITQLKIDEAMAIKVVACFHSWIGHWGSVTRNMRVREKMIALSALKPRIMSSTMWADTLELALWSGWCGGFGFLSSMYAERKRTILETLVRDATHNGMHLAIAQVSIQDLHGRRLEFLKEMYDGALGLCGDAELFSQSVTRTARRRLSFWLGRLFFISNHPSRLDEAISRWKPIVDSFITKPTVLDLEDILPVVTSLCSAYLQKVAQDPQSLEADRIISIVAKLHEVAAFSQKPTALKLRFRVSLCLARIYTLRDEDAKARAVLREHAEHTFAMLSQKNNQPLQSIGWLYLASILTTISINQSPDSETASRATRAWQKIQLFHPHRWKNFDFYGRRSNTGPNPPLPTSVLQKLEAIKAGEEYTFFDGILRDHVQTIWADSFHLPGSVTMVCEGRECRAGQKDTFPPFAESLQIPAGITFHDEWPPAQVGGCNVRIAFRVCRECMLNKLCVTCWGRLEGTALTATGCRREHDALIVPGSKDGVDYEVNEEDMEIVREEARRWGLECNWNVDDGAGTRL